MRLHIFIVLALGFCQDLWRCLESQGLEAHGTSYPGGWLLLIGVGCSVLSLVHCSLSSVLKNGG